MNSALLPINERKRHNLLHELQLAITQYKKMRTKYANKNSAENRYHLARAENQLVNATRQAAHVVEKGEPIE